MRKKISKKEAQKLGLLKNEDANAMPGWVVGLIKAMADNNINNAKMLELMSRHIDLQADMVKAMQGLQINVQPSDVHIPVKPAVKTLKVSDINRGPDNSMTEVTINIEHEKLH